MRSIVRVTRKHQVVAPKEARKALGVGSGDKLVVEVAKGKVMVKARPKSYAKYMLGLHSKIWTGVKVEEYVRKEREAWQKQASSRS